jgi:hypothetical protein
MSIAAGKCLGSGVSGIPRTSRQHFNSIIRDARHCGDCLGSGSPLVCSNIGPNLHGLVSTVARLADLARATPRAPARSSPLFSPYLGCVPSVRDVEENSTKKSGKSAPLIKGCQQRIKVRWSAAHGHRRLAMTKPWQLISLVLIALSLILAIADRAILQPMYLLVLALVVMYGTNTKFPWG